MTQASKSEEENERALLVKARDALERCAKIVDRNLYHQHEKIEDVPRIATAMANQITLALTRGDHLPSLAAREQEKD